MSEVATKKLLETLSAKLEKASKEYRKTVLDKVRHKFSSCIYL